MTASRPCYLCVRSTATALWLRLAVARIACRERYQCCWGASSCWLCTNPPPLPSRKRRCVLLLLIYTRKHVSQHLPQKKKRQSRSYFFPHKYVQRLPQHADFHLDAKCESCRSYIIPIGHTSTDRPYVVPIVEHKIQDDISDKGNFFSRASHTHTHTHTHTRTIIIIIIHTHTHTHTSTKRRCKQPAPPVSRCPRLPRPRSALSYLCMRP